MCQPNTNSFFDINWVSCENFSQIDQLLRGVLGWSGILWLPRQLHSLNLHFGLDMNFSKNKLLKFISVATPVGNNMVFNLESTLIENISAFPYTAICDCIFAFLDHIWHIRHHWYIRCNPKTYAIRFSVWQAIFGPKFQTYRPTFGTGLGWFTSIFGYFYNNIWVKYFLFRDVVLQMRLKYPY